MTAALTWRPVEPGDAERLLALQHAHQDAVLGHPDCTLNEVRDHLAEPDLDPRSLVVVDAEGWARGFACVIPHGGETVDVDVVAHPGADDELLRALLNRAVELAADAGRFAGRPEVRIDQGCYRDDARLAGALSAAGFTPATTFHRMRRELDRPVDVGVPDGVVPAGDRAVRAGRGRRLRRSSSASSQWHVAEALPRRSCCSRSLRCANAGGWPRCCTSTPRTPPARRGCTSASACARSSCSTSGVAYSERRPERFRRHARRSGSSGPCVSRGCAARGIASGRPGWPDRGG